VIKCEPYDGHRLASVLHPPGCRQNRESVHGRPTVASSVQDRKAHILLAFSAQVVPNTASHPTKRSRSGLSEHLRDLHDPTAIAGTPQLCCDLPRRDSFRAEPRRFVTSNQGLRPPERFAIRGSPSGLQPLVRGSVQIVFSRGYAGIAFRQRHGLRCTSRARYRTRASVGANHR
jgi:hypothetical protein